MDYSADFIDSHEETLVQLFKISRKKEAENEPSILRIGSDKVVQKAHEEERQRLSWKEGLGFQTQSFILRIF